MNFELFFEEAERINLRLENVSYKDEKVGLLDNEALFQLPFICLIILILAKDRRKPRVEELGQLVGECIEKTMPAFKTSKQKIGWSANLRIRTINAMTFLESAGFIFINNRKSKLEITLKGKSLIGSALKEEDNLAYTLLEISKSYRNICVARQLDLELE
ncbi:hypothetical protein ABRZ58_12330 [Vibrio vulnificus]|uniref:hypothetical protein n=1 Tax=Vibrio vulnificus TaxID=672 RepID=UPI0028C6EB55|nr:hypothetical protein [Vibrio vulnificus]HDY7740957.1 hypothetical protein [Vibrio vulnificus]HDY7970790.1 hypothetical protein [Vibrio vulnificus]